MCRRWSEPFGRFGAVWALRAQPRDDTALNMVLFPAVTNSLLTSSRGFTPRDYIFTAARLLPSLDLTQIKRPQSSIH